MKTQSRVLTSGRVRSSPHLSSCERFQARPRAKAVPKKVEPEVTQDCSRDMMCCGCRARFVSSCFAVRNLRFRLTGARGKEAVEVGCASENESVAGRFHSNSAAPLFIWANQPTRRKRLCYVASTWQAVLSNNVAESSSWCKAQRA